MSKITWDTVGKKTYETGTDRGVLYPRVSGAYPAGAAWNGLTAVTESPSGADENAFYADNIKYGSLRGSEDFGGTIECYSYPDEWLECDGSSEVVTGVVMGQQKRKSFGLTFRTLKGNDSEGIDYGYKLHLIYNATASPSERAYQTVNDSPEAITFSYEFTTTPINVTAIADAKSTACITVDSTLVDEAKLKKLEDALYGTDDTEAYLPLPDDVIAMLQ